MARGSSAPSEGTFERLALSGGVTLSHATHPTLAIARIEFEASGSLAEPTSLQTTIEAPLGEIRKLAAWLPALESILASFASEPDDATGRARLRAPPALLARLTEVARRGGADRMGRELMTDPGWVGVLFDIPAYEVEMAGVVSRSTS